MSKIYHIKFLMSKLIIAVLLATVFFCYQASAATITYSYDNLNRLKKMDYGNGMTIEYSYDAAGNRLTLVSVGDITTPDTSITSQPSNPTNSTSASFEFTSIETGSTFECQMDSGEYSACTSPKPYTGLTAGSHTFYVKATDSAGNTDSTPASYTWTIDTTNPTGSITAPSDNSYGNTTTLPVFTASASDAGGSEVASVKFQYKTSSAATYNRHKHRHIITISGRLGDDCPNRRHSIQFKNYRYRQCRK